MAKPIFIGKLPYVSEEKFKQIQINLEEKLYDYHVILIMSEVEDFTFNVFHEKDYEVLGHEQIKKLIELAKDVSEWDEEFSSTNLKLRAKEILKQRPDTTSTLEKFSRNDKTK